jgi:phosphoribosylanthranilate isomerase
MTQVKICGINDAVAFDTAVEAGADWLGFVFFHPSPRYVTPEAAAALSARSPGGPQRVGLFVNPTVPEIARVVRTVTLDILQLYGAPDDLSAFREQFGLPIWRAVAIGGAVDLPLGGLGADRLVVEAKPPAGADRPGGNATKFDWRLLQGWAAPADWMLAGGLTPANVGCAIRETGAEAVDVSSGVESQKGVKDPALIRAFIVAAKG